MPTVKLLKQRLQPSKPPRSKLVIFKFDDPDSPSKKEKGAAPPSEEEEDEVFASPSDMFKASPLDRVTRKNCPLPNVAASETSILLAAADACAESRGTSSPDHSDPGSCDASRLY